MTNSGLFLFPLADMSRSRRNTPIFGITACRSERQDKQQWHRRWRALERTAMRSASLSDLSDYLPRHENQIENAWSMGKDGHRYESLAESTATAERLADHRGRTEQERAALKQRYLRRRLGK